LQATREFETELDQREDIGVLDIDEFRESRLRVLPQQMMELLERFEGVLGALLNFLSST